MHDRSILATQSMSEREIDVTRQDHFSVYSKQQDVIDRVQKSENATKIQYMLSSFLQKLQFGSPGMHSGSNFLPIISHGAESPPLFELSPSFTAVSSPPLETPYKTLDEVDTSGSKDAVIDIRQYPSVNKCVKSDIAMRDVSFAVLFSLLLVIVFLLGIFLWQTGTMKI